MKHSPAFLALVEEVMPCVREVSADEVHAMQVRKEAFMLIDVREDNEWQAAHAQGAVHMSRGVIERDIEQEVPDKQATLEPERYMQGVREYGIKYPQYRTTMLGDGDLQGQTAAVLEGVAQAEKIFGSVRAEGAGRVIGGAG